ncbi:hypothetical protein JXA12_05980 [Candidatus Woesearchaeota archaeon]|nr:hypothetical protein [Candidatus Woesearchaeota archaeon]
MDYSKAKEILQIKKKNPSWIEIRLCYNKRLFETHPDITRKYTEEQVREVYEAFQFLKKNYSRIEKNVPPEDKQPAFKEEKLSEEIINAIKKNLFDKYISPEINYFKSKHKIFEECFKDVKPTQEYFFKKGIFKHPRSLLETDIDLLSGFLFYEDFFWPNITYETDFEMLLKRTQDTELLTKYILLSSPERHLASPLPLNGNNIQGLELVVDFYGPHKTRNSSIQEGTSIHQVYGKDFSVEDMLLNLRVGNSYEHWEGFNDLYSIPLCNAGDWGKGLDLTTLTKILEKITSALASKDFKIELSTKVPENFPLLKAEEKDRGKSYADVLRESRNKGYSQKYGFYIKNFVVEDFPLIVEGGPTDIKYYFSSPSHLE